MKKGISIAAIAIMTVLAIAFGVLFFTNNMEKTKQIDVLNADVAEKTGRIDALNADAAEKASQIDALNADVAEKASQIDALNADVAEKAGQIDVLNADVAEKASQIDALNADVAKKASQIDALNADVAKKAGQIDALNADVAEKAGQIDVLNADVAEKASQIDALNADVAEKAGQIDALSTDVVEKDNVIDSLNNELENKKDQIDTLENDKKEMADRIGFLEESERDNLKRIDELEKKIEEEKENNQRLGKENEVLKAKTNYIQMEENEVVAVSKEIIPILEYYGYTVSIGHKDTEAIAIKIGDREITEAELQSEIEARSLQTQYYWYGLYDPTSAPNFIDSVKEETLSFLKKEMVLAAKAAELGLDSLTVEEKETVRARAQKQYDNILEFVKTYELQDSGISGDELDKAATDLLIERGITPGYYIRTEKNVIIENKIRDYITKEVTVSEEEILDEYESRVEKDRNAYAENAGAWAEKANMEGKKLYYTPAGVRRVKSIAIMFMDADRKAVSDAVGKQEIAKAAVSMAEVKISDILTILTGEDNTTEIREETAIDLLTAYEEKDRASIALEAATQAVEEAMNRGFENIDAEVDSILQQLKEGVDWQQLMDEKNQDPGMLTREKGYAIAAGMTGFDLEYVNAGMALEKPGDVSDKVKGSNAYYYIIRYEGDETEGAVALENVQEEIRVSLLSRKQDEIYNTTLERWLEEADIEVADSLEDMMKQTAAEDTIYERNDLSELSDALGLSAHSEPEKWHLLDILRNGSTSYTNEECSRIFNPESLKWENNSVTLSADEWKEISRLYRNVFYDNGKGYIDLGTDNDFEIKGNSLVFGHDGTWLSIDRQPISCYYLYTWEDGEEYFIRYYTPALLNGRKVSIFLDFSDVHPYGEMTEAMTGILGEGLSETEEHIPVKEGDRVQFLYRYITYDGEEKIYALENEMVLCNEVEMANIPMDESKTIVLYQFFDHEGNSYWTPVLQ